MAVWRCGGVAVYQCGLAESLKFLSVLFAKRFAKTLQSLNNGMELLPTGCSTPCRACTLVSFGGKVYRDVTKVLWKF